MERGAADRAITPLWLAHHYPEDYDRCVRLGWRHVCRRCLVLYPLAFGTMFLALAGGWASGTAGLAVLVLLPVPAVVEFVGEHLGWWDHQPVRLVLVTLPLAVALGTGFARYLRAPADPAFWLVVAVYGGTCLTAALLGPRRRATGAGDGGTGPRGPRGPR